MLPTIEWKDDAVVMIDQRKLPGAEVYVTCKTANEVAKAIKTMVIRGAPAIGVAAGMGIALGMERSKATGTKQFAVEFQKTCDLMADTADPTPPCGPCRQVLWEFGGDLEVILANLRRETGRHALSKLLPLPFDARLLK